VSNFWGAAPDLLGQLKGQGDSGFNVLPIAGFAIGQQFQCWAYEPITTTATRSKARDQVATRSLRSSYSIRLSFRSVSA